MNLDECELQAQCRQHFILKMSIPHLSCFPFAGMPSYLMPFVAIRYSILSSLTARSPFDVEAVTSEDASANASSSSSLCTFTKTIWLANDLAPRLLLNVCNELRPFGISLASHWIAVELNDFRILLVAFKLLIDEFDERLRTEPAFRPSTILPLWNVCQQRKLTKSRPLTRPPAAGADTWYVMSKCLSIF